MNEKTEYNFIRNLNKRFKKCMVEYQLVQENDRIILGLSGGKDSLALVDLLSNKSFVHQKKHKIIAAYINLPEMSYQSDTEYLKDFCEQRNVEFISRDISYDMMQDKTKSTCFLCSWYRRKKFFELAIEYDCNKIALGHNMTDMVETLLLNMTFQANISSIPPKLKIFDGEKEIIRPLALLTEDMLLEYSRINKFKVQTKECIYQEESNRPAIKHIIKQLEGLNERAVYNIFSSMNNIKEEYLP